MLNFRVKNLKQKKGISLYLTLVVMAVVLGIGLGLSTIVINQMKMTREVGYSTIALIAAEAGIEKALFDVYKNKAPKSYYSMTLSNGASYEAKVTQPAGSRCQFSGIPEDENCEGNCYCIKSTGIYKSTRRTLEVFY